MDSSVIDGSVWVPASPSQQDVQAIQPDSYGAAVLSEAARLCRRLKVAVCFVCVAREAVPRVLSGLWVVVDGGW